MKQITTSPAIGIDTESIVGQTKFTKSDAQYQEAALIQIATKDKVFILDGFFAKN
jgi:ribonuclease D